MPRRARDIYSTVEIDQQAIRGWAQGNDVFLTTPAHEALTAINNSIRDLESEASRRRAQGEEFSSLRDAYESLTRQRDTLIGGTLPSTAQVPAIEPSLAESIDQLERIQSGRRPYNPTRTSITDSGSAIRFLGTDTLENVRYENYTWTGSNYHVGIDPGAEPPKPKPKPEPAYYMLKFGSFDTAIREGKPGNKYHEYISIRGSPGSWKLEFEKKDSKQIHDGGKDKMVVIYELCNVVLAKPRYEDDDEDDNEDNHD